jgi:ABC-type multidrug transport system ATPase subunit
MQIQLDHVAKRFGTEYILKEVSLVLTAGDHYILLGPNGSGKSTLMKILSGFLSPSKGRIRFTQADGQTILPTEIWNKVAYAAPYIELVEEMTMRELIHFQESTRGFENGMHTEHVIALTELAHAADRQIRFFSSGMKQRLKIALALTTKADIILLDEPTTNLDQDATKWYMHNAKLHAANRLLVVASNDPTDLDIATHRIQIQDFK